MCHWGGGGGDFLFHSYNPPVPLRASHTKRAAGGAACIVVVVAVEAPKKELSMLWILDILEHGRSRYHTVVDIKSCAGSTHDKSVARW